ncbi:tape measure protein [Microbacterium phage Matzah]|uniref:Tape measure protein n=1 Tax=Microbacterium phage Matzah TaxID=2686228 RepID=A0A6B9LEE1_9CAUD|nr:tape measure protein [Microbacterium phage Matzah]QHB37025.1 tape measure protein [Microbacterium phage Matzah]
MANGGNIGSVTITVEADASDIPGDVEKAAKGLSGVGERLGRLINQGLAKGLQGSLSAVVSGAQSTLQSGLAKAGEVASSALQRAFGPKVAGAITGFTAQLTTAEGRMNALSIVASNVGTRIGAALGPKITTGLQNLAAGFQNSTAAASSFTGAAGTIGGIVRGSLNIAGSAAKAFAGVAKGAFTGLVSVAQTVWDKIKTAASSAFSAIGRNMSATLSTAGKLAGTAVAATVGTALTKGFSRLEAIDTATAKLTGLGNSAADVDKIMTAATAAVRGTAYGLGDAASAAAQFAAAGVPLDGMQRSLSVLASAASVAGSDMGEMTTIFGKVAATGKLNGEVVQQLAERGIPILSLLAKQYGVTGEEAQKMVSEGKVGFEDFQKVLETNLGPAAAAMGQSFSGMLQNVGAALGRLGAAAQAPAFASLKTLFPPIMSAIDQLTPVVAALATALGERLAPLVQGLADALSGIDLTGFVASLTGAGGGAASFVNSLAPLTPILGLLAGALGPLLSGLPVIGGLFTGLTGPVGLFAGALVALLAFKPETLMAGFDSLAGSLPGMVTGIVNTISTLVPQMVSRIAANLPIFVTGILNLVTAVIPALTAAIPMLVQTFATLIPQIVNTLLMAIPQILTAALGLFQGIIQALITIIPQVVTSLVAMLPQLATALITALPLIIEAALALFMGLVNGLVEATPIIIAAVLELLPQLITTLLGMLPTIISSALELFLGVVTGLLEAIPTILTSLLGMLPQLIGTLLGMIPQLIQGAVQLFTGIVKALPIILPKLIDALIKLGPEMVKTLIGLVPQLLQAGVDLIGGLVSGLWEAAGSVGSALLDIASNAIGGFLDFLGIHSPSRLFAEFGRDTMAGYVKGIEKMSGQVDKAMTDVLEPALGNVSVSGTPTIGPNASATATAAGPQDNRRQTIIEEGAVKVEGPDPYKAAQETADALAEKVAA